MAKYLPIAGEATDLPINEIVINSLWAGLVIESLTPLRSPSAWAGTPEEIQHCIDQIDTIQDLLMGYDLIPPNIAFQATGSANQAIGGGTTPKITFDTEQRDVGGYYDTTTSRYTPLRAGTYGVWVVINFSAGNVRSVFLRKNGTQVATMQSGESGFPSNIATISLYVELDMNGTTDYLEVFGAMSGGGTVVKVGMASWWGARLVAW